MNSDQANNEVKIPFVPHEKMTEELIAVADALCWSLSAVNAGEAEKQMQERFDIPPGTLRRWKARLRQVLERPRRTPLEELARHPQLRQAVEFILVRKERTDKITLRGARKLSVLRPTGETLSVQELLKSLFPREGVNAKSCYEALVAQCRKKQILKEDGTPASIEDLPSESRVRVFLRQWRNEYVAVRRGRSRKHDWETMQQPYITRNIEQYHPGELWIGDHTELDFIVLNQENKPDRRWITTFNDIRTGLIVGYQLSWQPTSQTISLAFRSGVIGSQLRAFTGERFEGVSIVNVPEIVMIDNGKDYRSNYTQRIFGNVDFTDQARLSIQRITRLHYVMPYHAQSKAQMERWFRTIQTMIKYLPGYKGNRYQNTPDSLKEDVKQKEILPVDRFDDLVSVAINSYNNRPRRSLGGQSPLQSYLTNQMRQRTIDARVLDFLMLKADSRKIRRCQVTLMGQEYYSEALMTHNNKTAEVYYDPNDLGFISLYVGGQFAAVASNKEMIGREERGWVKFLHERRRTEKEMQEELKYHKRGISDREARMMLLEGELLNMNKVSSDLLQKKVPTIGVMTGMEEQAKEQEEKLKKEQEAVEIEERVRKRRKESPLSIAVVNERIR